MESTAPVSRSTFEVSTCCPLLRNLPVTLQIEGTCSQTSLLFLPLVQLSAAPTPVALSITTQHYTQELTTVDAHSAGARFAGVCFGVWLGLPIPQQPQVPLLVTHTLKPAGQEVPETYTPAAMTS